MEFANGGDLYHLLKEYKKKWKPCTENELWCFAYEILLGVEYLHSKNIIHRDIKTLNIFISQDRHIKLGDLGVSKIVNSLMPLQGTRVGTPLYLAPELIKQQPYSFKVDIWAIGWALYHLWCFEPPFVGNNLIILGNTIVNKKPKSIPKEYSAKFSLFVERLLAKSPENRPTARDAIKMIPKIVKTLDRYKDKPEEEVESWNSSDKNMSMPYDRSPVAKQNKNSIQQDLDVFKARPISAAVARSSNPRPTDFQKEKREFKIWNLINEEEINAITKANVQPTTIKNKPLMTEARNSQIPKSSLKKSDLNKKSQKSLSIKRLSWEDDEEPSRKTIINEKQKSALTKIDVPTNYKPVVKTGFQTPSDKPIIMPWIIPKTINKPTVAQIKEPLKNNLFS